MKKQKIVTLIIMLICISYGGYAQQQTTYEKKKAELIAKAWAKFGQDGASYVSSFSDKTDQEVYKSAEGIDAVALLLGRYTIGMQSLKWYAKELKQLESLKTNVDLIREKERAIFIKTQKEQEKYEKTDIGGIKKNIKLAFEQWNQKGEFEKESDYAIRLKNQSQKAFDSICTNKIKDKIKDKDSHYWKKELSAYNSESEFFTVSFTINDLTWQSNINIPITNAQSFKNDWSDLRFKIEDYDWCFVNNNLCPIVVTLATYTENSKYKFPVSLPNQSEILYVYDELKIENLYLSGHTYRYTNAKAIAEQQMREKQRLDSLELVTLNQRLDSTYNGYNRQLLENSLNVDRLLLKDYNKILDGNNRVDSFNRSVSSMEDDFKNLTADFKEIFNTEYEKNKNLFEDKDEFYSYYKNGKKAIKDETNSRKFRKFGVVTANLNLKNAYENYDRSLASTVRNPSVDEIIFTNDFVYFTHRVVAAIKLYENENDEYERLIDALVNENKELNKLWNKDGMYFKNNVAFFEAYTSKDYKNILKTNKKSFKKN